LLSDLSPLGRGEGCMIWRRERVLVIARSATTRQSGAAPQNWIASLPLAMTG
jgi:hypothetical protein